MKISMEVPKNFKIELPYDPSIALLSIQTPKRSQLTINSQIMESAYIATSRLICRENVVYIHSGVLCMTKLDVIVLMTMASSRIVNYVTC
jgi:hypothetical protein